MLLSHLQALQKAKFGTSVDNIIFDLEAPCPDLKVYSDTFVVLVSCLLI